MFKPFFTSPIKTPTTIMASTDFSHGKILLGSPKGASPPRLAFVVGVFIIAYIFYQSYLL